MATPMAITEIIVELIVSFVLSSFSKVVNKSGRISKKRPSAAVLSCINTKPVDFVGFVFVLYTLQYVKTVLWQRRLVVPHI